MEVREGVKLGLGGGRAGPLVVADTCQSQAGQVGNVVKWCSCPTPSGSRQAAPANGHLPDLVIFQE